jgi:hypothetical protein
VSRARSILAFIVFAASGLWALAALFLVPISLPLDAKITGAPLQTYLRGLADILLPIIIMVLAFRLRRSRKIDAQD